MFGLGPIEIVIIVLALGILIFGHKKITGLARSLGRFGGEFKKSKRDIENELKKGEDQSNGQSDNNEESK